MNSLEESGKNTIVEELVSPVRVPKLKLQLHMLCRVVPALEQMGSYLFFPVNNEIDLLVQRVDGN